MPIYDWEIVLELKKGGLQAAIQTNRINKTLSKTHRAVRKRCFKLALIMYLLTVERVSWLRAGRKTNSQPVQLIKKFSHGPLRFSGTPEIKVSTAQLRFSGLQVHNQKTAVLVFTPGTTALEKSRIDAGRTCTNN